MCDFSLMHVKSRSAAVDDKLITTDFSSSSSHGFAAVGDLDTAVCVLPGTEIAFEENIKTRSLGFMFPESAIHEYPHKVARFRQVELGNPHTHHDALELPDGTIVKLHLLVVGQHATVLQLPAAPKSAEEAKAQERLAIAG